MSEQSRLLGIGDLIAAQRMEAIQRVSAALQARVTSNAYDGDALDFDELAEIAVDAAGPLL